MGREADCYALDLSPNLVRRSLDTISSIPFKNIRCHSVLGTYDDARDWLQSSANRDTPKCILSLGSSVGNLTDMEAVEFIKNFAGPLYRKKKLWKDQQNAAGSPMEDVMFEGTLLKAGTRILVSQSQKFNTEHRAKLWEGAGVRHSFSSRCRDTKYGMLSRPWARCCANIEGRQ